MPLHLHLDHLLGKTGVMSTKLVEFVTKEDVVLAGLSQQLPSWIGGHGTSANEQKTQQSPSLGRNF